jgi:SAM-dependent methyltransferase
MSYLGADWLVRATREAEEQPEAMLDALKIAPGSTVADVGAGVGYTSLRLARRVGPEGTVLATDVQPQMVRMLKANAQAAGVRNVRPILCTPTDPKLPEGQVDLVLMVDVYHECSDPEATLRGVRRALKPGGRLVLVEFRGEGPRRPDQARAQDDRRPGPQGDRAPGLHLPGDARLPALAAHHRLPEAGRRRRRPAARWGPAVVRTEPLRPRSPG